jgi:hypothetical protein
MILGVHPARAGPTSRARARDIQPAATRGNSAKADVFTSLIEKGLREISELFSDVKRHMRANNI